MELNNMNSTLSRRQLLAAAVAGVLGSGIGSAQAVSVTDGLVLPKADDSIRPFRVTVPQTAIDDLKQRLAHTRWPEQETVADWSQGVPLAKAKTLVSYWREQYDWRQFESRINALPQYRTAIDGLGIHFIHVRSPHPDALPILLTHGWPGSFVEFMDIIGPLSDPTRHGGRAEDAFHVVVPSLPGFGFSDKPAADGWNLIRIANAWVALMKRLGYDRWVAQGGDWGAGVTHALARMRPEGLIAAHVNWQFVFPSKLPEQPTPAERHAMDRAAWFLSEQSGYFREQGTRPQTVGYGLADSPTGQALWIYEKFQAWTDNHGNPEDALSISAMLNNISLYWFTNTAASSARIYWENTRAGLANFSGGRIDLPMAGSVFPHEIYAPPRAWAEAAWPNLFYWNELDKGGHFAAFEQPRLFTEELRKAFRSKRNS
ncbi:putative hydrolase or acyltransferase of alpha/beta superfamily [Herbaspirillum sp. CF444]|uniref:epoxide hydrolase family protein n=1 Tax=Herbaspirillum sp. CF444 TaxID=1144319 RepID=UPI000272847C|nr:putative hydrolase or acyltransferase of alpha/beta superfamily [Herbaspirillum sp. CF444]